MVEHLADFQERKLVGLRRCHEGLGEGQLLVVYPSGLIHQSADLCNGGQAMT